MKGKQIYHDKYLFPSGLYITETEKNMLMKYQENILIADKKG